MSENRIQVKRTAHGWAVIPPRGAFMWDEALMLTMERAQEFAWGLVEGHRATPDLGYRVGGEIVSGSTEPLTKPPASPERRGRRALFAVHTEMPPLDEITPFDVERAALDLTEQIKSTGPGRLDDDRFSPEAIARAFDVPVELVVAECTCLKRGNVTLDTYGCGLHG